MTKTHICPWQSGNILAMPARKLFHNPERMLRPYLSEGMTVMDVGAGMGFFTLPIAEMVGKSGTVIAADLQQEMLNGILRKADKAGTTKRITPRKCSRHSMDIADVNGTVDFALLMMMLHEVPDPERLVREVYYALKPGGKLLFAEPIMHVSKTAYQDSLQTLHHVGFVSVNSPRIAFCRAMILKKNDIQ